ncbi:MULTISPECIES: integrase core domain-containing protein [unclassified Salipiger]|uniref:integrase core domain-containing protein n=1 Tax=Salipiger sp. PrR002 TaxID=2706489 RepID=UPI0013BD3EB4|nr:transposase [Salipiger sp. PrR002]NDW56776.1 transposase [Salipiger sp. PrR004]
MVALPRWQRVAITCRQRLFPTCYGTDLTSTATITFAPAQRVEWRYNAPGKAVQNVFVDSVHGRMQGELLNEAMLST